MDNPLETKLLPMANEAKAAHLARFFKTGPGQYAEGDRFLGIAVPDTRAVVKAHWSQCTPAHLEQCLASSWHEVRLAALLTLVQHYDHHAKKADTQGQQRCIDFYMNHLPAVNNWDLVDLSCYQLLGHWLLDKDAAPLRHLATHGRTIWQQRIGIVSTMQFVRHGRLDDTYQIALLLQDHPHDLIHKAVGWLLREAGKRDPGRLRQWLDEHCNAMPRTTLRYAIEHFSPAERQHYMHSPKTRLSC